MIEINNLLAAATTRTNGELIETLLRGGRFRLERIVSTGQETPKGQWYDQSEDEWVVLLSGAAQLRFASDEQHIELKPGDYLNIPAHSRHRVEWTDPTQSTVWLALHYTADADADADANAP